jgi:hypothetical protein
VTTEVLSALEWYVEDLVIFKDGDRIQFSWTCRHVGHRGYLFSVRVTDVTSGVLKLLAVENAAHQEDMKCLAASSSEDCQCELYR